MTGDKDSKGRRTSRDARSPRPPPREGAPNHRASSGLGSTAESSQPEPRATQTRAAAPPICPLPRVALEPEAAGRAGLSPSGRPAHSRALRRGFSARTATARTGLPALQLSRGTLLAPRRRAPSRPPGWYLLGEREERRRHLPADSGSERRGMGRGRACALMQRRCARSCAGVGGAELASARAAEPRRRGGVAKVGYAHLSQAGRGRGRKGAGTGTGMGTGKRTGTETLTRCRQKFTALGRLSDFAVLSSLQVLVDAQPPARNAVPFPMRLANALGGGCHPTERSGSSPYPSQGPVPRIAVCLCANLGPPH